MHPEQGFELRPRTIGELLDLTFRVYRRGFKVFAVLGIAVTTISVVIGTLIQAMLVDPAIWADLQDQARALGAMGRIYTSILVVLLINIFIYGLGMVAITAAAEDTLLGRPVGAAQSLSKSWRRSVWAGIASVLMLLAALACAMACLLPAIPVLIVLSLTVSLVYLERKGPIEAMRRSFELVAKRGPRALSIDSNWVRIAIVGFVTLIVVYMLSLLASLPVFIASGTAALRGGGMMNQTAFGPQLLPLHLLLPLQLVGAVFHGVFVAIGIIPWTVMYYDIRTRHEGLDLELQAQSLAREDGPVQAPGS